MWEEHEPGSAAPVVEPSSFVAAGAISTVLKVPNVLEMPRQPQKVLMFLWRSQEESSSKKKPHRNKNAFSREGKAQG